MFSPAALHRHLLTVVVMLLLISQVSCLTALAQALEADIACQVYRVIDGDTIRCTVVKLWIHDEIGGDVKVRLADINAPELRPEPEPGAMEALSVLEELVLGETVVLDVDDRHVFDRYGRVVAVVLVKWNTTHWLNVNKFLVLQGLAEVWEHDNQWILMDTPLFRCL